MPSFGTRCNYNKLKTNLRLTMNRLKLLEKKKTEIALKSRKEIADYIHAGKEDRGRIRVEHIIREDYMVEALELIESYCDLILARFGLVETQKEIDPGLQEAIASILWATPRLQSEVQEFTIVSRQFTSKYGKEWTNRCLTNADNNVSEKVMLRLGVQAPPKALVERYMMEIAKSYNVPFVPDASVMIHDEVALGDLIAASNPPSELNSNRDDQNRNDGGGFGGFGGSGGGGGGIAVPSGPGNMPQLPYPQATGPATMPNPIGFAVPPPPPATGPVCGPTDMMPPSQPPTLPPPYTQSQDGAMAGPLPPKSSLDLPELPQVPSHSGSFDAPQTGTSSSADFDDLAKRFEELKRKK